MHFRCDCALVPISLSLTIMVMLFLGPGGSSIAIADSSVLESRLLKIGATAPPFSAETIDGGEYMLENTLGKKPVLIFFWSFFCGPCREEIPILQDIYTQLGENNLEFLGVNLDGKGLAKAIKKFITDSNYQFISIFDELDGLNYKVADPYGVAGTPTAYIIDLDGKIAFSTVGHTQPEELKQIIEGILAGS